MAVRADKAVDKIISGYTAEAGVRSLERRIGECMRKVVLMMAQDASMEKGSQRTAPPRPAQSPRMVRLLAPPPPGYEDACHVSQNNHRALHIPFCGNDGGSNQGSHPDVILRGRAICPFFGERKGRRFCMEEEKKIRRGVNYVELETVCGITSTLPENLLPEFAFAGRSNVGKSSLINALMFRKSYARYHLRTAHAGYPQAGKSFLAGSILPDTSQSSCPILPLTPAKPSRNHSPAG